MLEAVFMAMPVVTTDVPGFRERVTERISGRLVSTRDVRLIDAVVRVGAASREGCWLVPPPLSSTPGSLIVLCECLP
jgi:hypothetical protein